MYGIAGRWRQDDQRREWKQRWHSDGNVAETLCWFLGPEWWRMLGYEKCEPHGGFSARAAKRGGFKPFTPPSGSNGGKPAVNGSAIDESFADAELAFAPPEFLLRDFGQQPFGAIEQ